MICDIMSMYYFDIETYSPGERPNPDSDKIITIQFQRLDLRTGRPIGRLIILKEWESSEQKIISRFYNLFFHEDSNVWDFVPVGFNLNFEWEFLISKFNKYFDKTFTSRDFHYSRPYVDLHPIAVLLNEGKFRGASLDNFSEKSENGAHIKDWYASKNYARIIDYIENETNAYFGFLQKLISNVHKLDIKPKRR